MRRRGSFAYKLPAGAAAGGARRALRAVDPRRLDQHSNLPTQFRIQCQDTRQPSAALVKDLKQRGLPQRHAGDLGRRVRPTVFGQGDIDNPRTHGRDHHGRCFTVWMAGGGVRPA